MDSIEYYRKKNVELQKKLDTSNQQLQVLRQFVALNPPNDEHVEDLSIEINQIVHELFILLNKLKTLTNKDEKDNEIETPVFSSPSPTKLLEGKILNILLVEDSKLLQQIFKKWFSTKGHNVFLSNNGQEAFELFKSQKFNIIFTDIEMPIRDGLSLCTEIRTFERENSKEPTPVIGVSGYSTKQYKERALESGMNDFISKTNGYQFNAIYEIVKHYCG